MIGNSQVGRPAVWQDDATDAEKMLETNCCLRNQEPEMTHPVT